MLREAVDLPHWDEDLPCIRIFDLKPGTQRPARRGRSARIPAVFMRSWRAADAGQGSMFLKPGSENSPTVHVVRLDWPSIRSNKRKLASCTGAASYWGKTMIRKILLTAALSAVSLTAPGPASHSDRRRFNVCLPALFEVGRRLQEGRPQCPDQLSGHRLWRRYPPGVNRHGLTSAARTGR